MSIHVGITYAIFRTIVTIFNKIHARRDLTRFFSFRDLVNTWEWNNLKQFDICTSY